MARLDRDLRQIDRTLIRSTVEAAAIVARIDPCPMSHDPESALWVMFTDGMRALAGTLALQDKLLDMRLSVA